MNVIVRFPVKQAVNFILCGEAFDAVELVFEYALMQIASNPDVQGSRATGEMYTQ